MRVEAFPAKTAGVRFRSSSIVSVRPNAWLYSGAMDVGFVGDLPTAPNPHAAAQRATAEHRELVSAVRCEALRARPA